MDMHKDEKAIIFFFFFFKGGGEQDKFIEDAVAKNFEFGWLPTASFIKGIITCQSTTIEEIYSLILFLNF